MESGAPDGLPLPPLELIYTIGQEYDLDHFYRQSVLGAESIQTILASRGADIASFSAILDFGCGCGRLLRRWKALNGTQVYGTDYNERLVEWCRASLPFARVSVNPAASRLTYEDDKFDFIYTISVFTHLSEEVQHFWIRELGRVLKPGGYLYVTVLGSTRLHQLRPEERTRFESGELVLRNTRYSGKNVCEAFHPERFVREKLADGLTVLDFVPGGAQDANQDVYLMQKPGRSGPKSST